MRRRAAFSTMPTLASSTPRRNAFPISRGDAGLGTTNVDYSLALFEHFQTLRSYRPTVVTRNAETQASGRALLFGKGA